MEEKNELRLNYIEKNLRDFYKNNKNYLEEKSPYNDIDLDDIIGDFLKGIKYNEEFSWIKRFLEKEEKQEEKKEGYANLNYNIPTHIHGDYKNGLIYLCLLNPSSKISDDKKYGTENINDKGIKFYYDEMIKENLKRKDNKLYKEDIYEVIKNWLDEQSDENEIKEKIEREIIDSNISILTKELNYEEGIDGYYFDKYFKPLLKNGYDKNIMNKIVNIELCPFRSSKSKNIKKLLGTKYSNYSIKIILYRIGKYLAENEDKRPIFIFRSFKNWEDQFLECISEILGQEVDDNIKSCMLEFRAKYFYRFPNRSGSMSQINIVKFLTCEDYNEILDNLKVD